MLHGTVQHILACLHVGLSSMGCNNAAHLSQHSVHGRGSDILLCMHQDGENLYKGWEDGKDGLAHHFMAGILAHLPALQAFTIPTPLSYERMKPGGDLPTVCPRSNTGARSSASELCLAAALSCCITACCIADAEN